MLLHYPYEVRQPDEYFGDIPAEKAPKEMIELAAHIIDTMAGHFDPEKFNDRYEDAPPRPRRDARHQLHLSRTGPIGLSPTPI
jgi:non-homologous end joining protein Ku